MITHKRFIKKYDLKKSDYYQENEWLYIYNLRVNEIKINELPSKIEFTKECDTHITFTVFLENIKIIPSDVIFNNNGNVEIDYVEEILENVVFNNNGHVRLGSFFDKYKTEELKKIHPSVKFTNNGDIYLGGIIDKIPKEISFNNKGNITICFVKEISENVTFSNNGKLKFYGKLEKIHPSVNFINNGDISFEDDIIEIPSGVTFNNIGKVDLYYIKKILENVIFNNEGDVIFNPRQKIIFSKGVKFNNKGNIVNIPINISKFLDPKMYLNKMIKQIYK